MDLEALFAELWYGRPVFQHQSGSGLVAPSGPLQRQESYQQRPSLDHSVASTAGSVADDEDDIAGLVPSALTVTTPPPSTWRRVFRYAVSADSTAGSLPPSTSAAAASATTSGRPSPQAPAALIVPPLAPPAAAAAAGGCSSSEPPSPSSPLLGAAGLGSGRSTPLMAPASPSDAAEALMSGAKPEVAFPLGRAALVAVIKQTSFSAPPQARPEETLASAQSPPGGSGTAQVDAACCPRAASVGAGRASAAACGGSQRQPHVPAWTSAFGGATGAAALQSWPLLQVAGQQQQQQQQQPKEQQASKEQQQKEEELPDSTDESSDATALVTCGLGTPSDAIAWRYRFTNKWRRARHVNAVDRFDDSPDPLAFIAAHGAATAMNLATNGGKPAAAVGLAHVLQPPAVGAAAAADLGLPPAAPAAAASALPPAARQAPRQACAVAARFAAGSCNSGASSLAGSWLPRVFSGGDMHRQLVAEAQRAHAALEQLSEAQQREQMLLQQRWGQRQ